MKNIFLAVLLALTVSGCAGLQQKIDLATGAYEYATTKEVPAEVVIPVANTFDILKAAATNYGRYCIQQQMAPSICSADVRRVVIKAVRSGTGARDQLKYSLRNNQPAAASVYNILVSAVNGLKSSPAASTQFAGG